MSSLKHDVSKVGLVLQMGYFNSTHKFFTANKFRHADIYYVAKLLGVAVKPQTFIADYKDRTRNHHKLKILELMGYDAANHHEDFVEESIADLTSKQMHPRQILFSVIDLLIDKKIETPNYDYFAKIITKHQRLFETNMIKKLKTIIQRKHMAALDDLLKEDKAFEHGLLTKLKNISQATNEKSIRENIHNYLILKRLYLEIKELIEALGISHEAIRFYAGWIIKAHTKSQIFDIKDKYKQYLYLACFLSHQYACWQDTLLEINQKCVAQYLAKVEKAFNAYQLKAADEKNKLGKSLLQKYKNNLQAIDDIKAVLMDEILNNDQKINILKKMLLADTDQKDMGIKNEFGKFEEALSGQEEKNMLYRIMAKQSPSLQKRVGNIIKHLEFIVPDQSLAKAINYYQQEIKVTRNAPGEFLNNDEYYAVFEQNKFSVPLYKSILFLHVYENIRAGTISLSNSHKYLPIEKYMMDETLWQRNKQHILKRLGLDKFADIQQVLQKLQERLDNAFTDVNKRILNKENKYVKLKNAGDYTMRTPKVEKPDYLAIGKIFESFENVPILSMMRNINTLTNFTAYLQHYKVKDNISRPSLETFYAGLFAMGSNMGAYQLANTSIGVSYKKIANAINWYFSLENLYQVNKAITGFMSKLWLPELFQKEKNLLHSSSDAQKRCVTAESLNANFSYKYFGHGKGANVYTFIDARGILIYTSVFSSAERDAAYVIDGLNHNDDLKPDMHSTDTHGYTETIFGISHLLDIVFAPRIQNIKKQVLSLFDSIRKSLEAKGYSIVPRHKINTQLITGHWDLILRLVASIKTKEFKASFILKRLASYAKQHVLQNALKEFGRIIKSIFILDYINNVELRQDIEKQLNKGELANRFSGIVAFANNQEVTQTHKEDQEIAAMCKLIIQNIIILWNYIELTKIVMRTVDPDKRKSLIEDIKQSSIITWRHINMFGLYDFRAEIADNDPEFDVEKLLAFRAA